MVRSAWWVVCVLACVPAHAAGVETTRTWWIRAAPDAELTWPSVAAGDEGFLAACVRLTPDGADLLVVAADGDGRVRGEPRVLTRSSNRSGIGAPALAADRHGYALVWEQSDDAWSTIRMLRLTGDGTPLGAPRVIGDRVPRSRPLGPRIALAGGGPAASDGVVVWTDWRVDPPVARAAWIARDGEVTTVFSIQADADAVTGPDVAPGPAGIAVAWIQGDAPSRVMTASVPPGDTTLRDPREISDESVRARRTWVRVSTRLAGAAATWCEAEGVRLVVRTRARTAGGRWSTILTPGLSTDGHELSPSCVIDRAGILCAWEGGGLPGPHVYARRLHDGAIDGEPLILSWSEAHSPALAGGDGRRSSSACVWVERERPEWPHAFGLRVLTTGPEDAALVAFTGPGASAQPAESPDGALRIPPSGRQMRRDVHEDSDALVQVFRADGRRVAGGVRLNRTATGTSIDFPLPPHVPVLAVVRTPGGTVVRRVLPLCAGRGRLVEIGYFRR